LRIGTWNRPGARSILKQEVQKLQMDLVALHEISWLGNGNLEKKNCLIFYTCNPVRHVFGIRFYVNSRFLSNILRSEPVNDRLCWIRVRGKHRNYGIINAHDPIEHKDNEEKDKLYLELKTVYSQCLRRDIKMVLGYFNTKVGKDENNYRYAGRNGMHEECNVNGYKLVQFGGATDVIIGGTISTNKNIHKKTWRSPDGEWMDEQNCPYFHSKETFL